MKKIKIKKEDNHDLIMFLGGILNGGKDVLDSDGSPKIGSDGKKMVVLFTRSLDFKEIVLVQKTKDNLVDSISSFVEKYNAIVIQRDSIVESANKKIASFKSEMLEKADKKEGKIPEDYQMKVASFVTMANENALAEINKEINPAIEKLFEKEGKDMVDVELPDDKYKILMKVFEEHSSDLFQKKEKMVLIYDTLSAAE